MKLSLALVLFNALFLVNADGWNEDKKFEEGSSSKATFGPPLSGTSSVRTEGPKEKVMVQYTNKEGMQQANAMSANIYTKIEKLDIMGMELTRSQIETLKQNPNIKSVEPDYDDVEECGNGVCDKGENCLKCPSDCISGTSGGFDCGNGVCEDGETCYTCPDDCKSDLFEDQPYYCCYGGPTDPGVPFAVSCDDKRCGKECSSNGSPLISYCCGDGVCQGEETELNCLLDNCISKCGNGICDLEDGENADNCNLDCKCNLDGHCDAGETVNSCPLDCTCGNYVCDVDLGENVANCPHDCDCNANYMCDPWEDKNNCPMDNCADGVDDIEDGVDDIEDEDEKDDENSSGDECKKNGESCQGHDECCSFACDEICVG